MKTKNICYTEGDVVFQTIDPREDIGLVNAFIDHLSPASMRARFGHTIREEYWVDTFLQRQHLTILLERSEPVALCDYSDLQLDKEGRRFSDIARIVRDDRQGKGYGSVIHRFFVRQLSDLGADYLLSMIDLENAYSIRLAQKNHFVLHPDYASAVVEARFYLKR